MQETIEGLDGTEVIADDFITDKGKKPDPKKVETILDMPMPTDVKGVRRLIGTVHYLGKFVKGLTDLTAPLRELTRKDSEFT